MTSRERAIELVAVFAAYGKRDATAAIEAALTEAEQRGEAAGYRRGLERAASLMEMPSMWDWRRLILAERDRAKGGA